MNIPIAKKLHLNDEVKVKRTGEILKVDHVVEEHSAVLIYCTDGSIWLNHELA
jgi:hypothetical protein